MARFNPSYLFFQTRNFPLLPYLIYEAKKIKKSVPKLPPQSEKVILKGEKNGILILGESTVAGVGATELKSTLVGNLHSLFKSEYTFYNFGKNGIRASEVLPEFKSDLATIQSGKEGIILYLGGNDCFNLTSPNSYHRSLQKLIESLQSQFNPNWIFLGDIAPVHLFPAFSPLMKSYLYQQREFLRKEMKQLAATHKKVIFQEINLDLGSEFFSADGIHPSNLGYRKIAEFTFREIKEHLEEVK